MTYRELLQSQSTLADARSLLQLMIRRAARKRIFDYAQRHYIYDFDAVTAEAKHRDYRDTVLAFATTKFNEAQAATNATQLAAVFDTIEQHLEGANNAN